MLVTKILQNVVKIYHDMLMVSPRIRLSPYATLCGRGSFTFLLDGRAKVIYSINESGTFLWQCFADGLSVDQVVRRFVDLGNVSNPVARNHVAAALWQWRRLGIAGSDRSKRLDYFAHAPGSEVSEPKVVCPASRETPSRVPSEDGALAIERRYRLLDTVFSIRLPDTESAAAVDQALGCIGLDGLPADEVLRVVAAGDGFLLTIGEEPAGFVPPNGLVPAIKSRIIHKALDRDAFAGTLHAAAISMGGRGILLPAPSGSGKSTLTAALVSTGFSLIADDVVVFARTRGIRPLPTAICLKEGSWPHLVRYRPELTTFRIHIRDDGKHVRYILPNHRPEANEVSVPVSHIVFPRYDPCSRTKLAPLTTREAVERLLPLMFSRSGVLDASHLERAIELAVNAECIELQLRSLEEGMRSFRKAVQC